MNLDYLLYGTPDDPRTERSDYPDDEDEAPDASAECEEVAFDDPARIMKPDTESEANIDYFIPKRPRHVASKAVWQRSRSGSRNGTRIQGLSGKQGNHFP